MFNKVGSRAGFLVRSSFLSIALAAAAAPAAAQDVPILQPGAPGQAPRVLSPAEAIRIANTRFSPADVRFMQNMIQHHRQAVEMAALVKGRTARKDLLELAARIDATQADEMAFMDSWLRQRGQSVPPASAGHAHHGDAMPGMATPEQMAALRTAKGTEFERLFLERMIAHHEGAVEMVEDLLDLPGTAYDPVLLDFTSDVKSEQEAEIKRMSTLLVGLSADPRSNLKAGFRDAGQAINNLRLVASLPKPTGFFDPANQAGLPPEKPADPDAKPKPGEDPDFGERSPHLSFANTDLAFSGDLMAVGSYHGFNLYRLGEAGLPRLITSVVCPGGQGDVSIVGNILIMSVEQTSGRVDCGLGGVAEDVSPERFRGLRIFDISNPARPVQVGQVQTCRGSHTHSVVSATAEKLIVYNSGTSSIRKEKELAGCIDTPGDERLALFRIDVIEIPLADPSKARIVDSPAVFADPATGRLAGLWQGGDHGDDTQETRRTDQCHDITVFPSRNLAAGACSGNGILFDIDKARAPKRLDAVVDPGFAYWHSATFNNDGTKVLFTDEWGGGSRARCRAQDQRNWGANAIYDIVDGKLVFRSYYKLPAPQTEQENCVAHNGSIIPVPGRDIFVQAWYQGGISVIDFTDSANPREIAYFDRGPVHDKHLILGGFWSVYWYNGLIYGTEIARGLDVLALQPSPYLTVNEIAAARLADQGERFNPQQQHPVTWPDHPMVARAYVDQLVRAGALAPAAAAEFATTLAAAEAHMGHGSKDKAVAAQVNALRDRLDGVGGQAGRVAALRETLAGLARQLD